MQSFNLDFLLNSPILQL